MPPKRPNQEAFLHDVSDDYDALPDTTRTKMKLPRNPANDVNSDFSAQVKNRLSQYSRTGQACDRCKVRKIKCDALPDGCSHCIQQNLDCFVTDRVTGRTEKRGYMRELERKKQQMESHIRALEKMLGDNGIEVKPWSQSSLRPPPLGSFDEGTPEDRDSQDWSHANGDWEKESPRGSDTYKPQRFTRPKIETRPADRHLGVGTDNMSMSSINGTQLSILGATVDITDFDGADMEEPSPRTTAESGKSRPLYNKSVQSLWQSIHRVNPTPNVQLPPKAEGLQYAEWYFRIMSPFLPVLHKPTVVKLLTRLYDDVTFQPSAAELAVAHMVMAFIFGQKAIRNPGQLSSHEDNKRSNLHYHFALSKFYDLQTSKTMAGVQAMGLIAVYCRSFPKPGCSSIVAQQALRYAIDLDLHRAVKRPAGTTNLETEMRKRTFWTVLAILVTVDGRLGRPMPITVDEYDVDFPEAIADELLTDEDIDISHKGHCAYHPGLAAFRITPLMIEMYSNIYSVRRDPGNYSSVIKHLEQQLHLWREELPESYRSQTADSLNSEMQIHPLYVQVMELDYRLSLRHPSVAVQSDRELCAENSRICEETAAELLKVYKILSDINALDTTWYSVSVYLAAMFSTLVAHWERRFIVTPVQIKKLESDMKDWLKVISSGASLFGSSSQICTKVQGIVERTIRSIVQDSAQKTSRSAPPTTQSTPPVKREKGAASVGHIVPINYPEGTPAVPLPSDSSGSGSTGTRTLGHMPKAYSYTSSAPQQAYPNMAYAAAPFDSGSGYMYSQANAASAPPVLSGAVEANPLINCGSQATQHVVEPTGSDQYYWRQAQGTNWQEWAAAMASNQDQYGANALMTMGRDLHAPAATTTTTTIPPDMATQQWPMLLWGGHEQPGA